jgi:predicted outer membrane protein
MSSYSPRTKHKTLMSLAVSGALLSGGFAFAAPAPDTYGTPANKTSPASPGAPSNPTTGTATPTPTPAPSPETTPPPARGVESRTGEGRPAADPMTTSPAAPTGVVNERDVPGHATTMSPKAARDATKVLNDLHKANQLEIALAGLARDKASSDAVKEYAKEVVESHQDADKKLALYGATHGLVLADMPAGSASSQILGSPSATAGTTAGMGSTTTAPRDLPSPSSTGSVPAGAATGGPSRPGDVASAGNPGTTAAGNPRAPVATGTPAAAPGTASDITATPALDAEGKKLMAKLEKAEGDAFDKQFLTAMVKTHGKALGKIKAAQSQKLEAELAGLVSDARTMTESHLQRAKELQRPASASL